MEITRKVCLMSEPVIDGKVNLLVAEIVADIADGEAQLDKSKSGYFFKRRDNSTYETETLEYVSAAWQAAKESKKYFSKPLDTVRINELTKGALDDIQRDFKRSQVKERLEKFVAELRDLERKYKVFLRAETDEDLVEIDAVDSEYGKELIALN